MLSGLGKLTLSVQGHLVDLPAVLRCLSPVVFKFYVGTLIQSAAPGLGGSAYVPFSCRGSLIPEIILLDRTQGRCVLVSSLQCVPTTHPQGVSEWSRSVMSDSLRPHELWHTRLLCPWDFPGKGTGVGCHFLLQGTPTYSTLCHPGRNQQHLHVTTAVTSPPLSSWCPGVRHWFIMPGDFGNTQLTLRQPCESPLPRLEMKEEVHFSLWPCGVMRSHSTENIVYIQPILIICGDMFIPQRHHKHLGKYGIRFLNLWSHFHEPTNI